MSIKRGSVDGGCVGNIFHRNLCKRLFRQELHKGIVQELPGSAHPRIEALAEIIHPASLRLTNSHCLNNMCRKFVYTPKYE